LKIDIRELRSELKTDINGLRAESSSTKEELGGVKVEIAKLRDELHSGLAAVRAELQTGLADVRAQMLSGDDRLHRLIDRTSLTDRIWMLMLIGAVLAVMAHGFKWI
jgi:hypothetical protein